MFLIQCNYEPNAQLRQRKSPCESAPSVRSDHYIFAKVMFSEASVLGLIHCVVAYKGVLTLIFGYRLVWNYCDILSTSVKVDLKSTKEQKYLQRLCVVCQHSAGKRRQSVIPQNHVQNIVSHWSAQKCRRNSERDEAAFNNINHLNHIILYIYTYTSVEMYRHTTSTWTLGPAVGHVFKMKLFI